MPVCGNYLFFELPKKIVLNPKDGNQKRKGMINHAGQKCPVFCFRTIKMLV